MFALASAGLVLALQVPSSLQRVLSASPLVALGAISYGVYLYHWPIFLLVERHGPSNHVVGVRIAVAITIVAAAGSYRLIEYPIRRGAGTRVRLAAAGGISLVAIVALSAVATPSSADDRFANPDQATSQLDSGHVTRATGGGSRRQRRSNDDRTSDRTGDRTGDPARTVAPSTDAGTTPTTTTQPPVSDVVFSVTPSRPVRLLVVGDSTAWALGDGLVAWADANPGVADVTLAVSPGCGLIRTGFVTSDADTPFSANCLELLDQRLPVALSELQPDVVLLMTARTDLLDRIWSIEEGEMSNADPRFQERQRAEYQTFVDWLMATSPARLMWIQPIGIRRSVYPDDEASDPERLDVLSTIISDVVAASDPTRVVQFDLPAWYAMSGLDDELARPDGMHFDVTPATQVAARLVGPAAVNFALASP